MQPLTPVSCLVLTDIDTLRAEVFPCLCYLLHDLLVRLWYVVEGEYAPAELEEKVGAEGDEGPEGKLRYCQRRSSLGIERGRGTYYRHDVILYLLRHGHDLHEYCEVHLSHVSIQSSCLE
jgi:hypothetical protein